MSPRDPALLARGSFAAAAEALASPLASGAARAERLPTVLFYGGGLDSFAMLLDADQRGELPDVCVFADVGDPDHLDPGEWPATYRHIDEVVKPLCARLGVPFITLDTDTYPVRDARSLFEWLEVRGQIPVTGPTRICTRIAKVERCEQWLDDHYPGQEVETWVGFDAAEEGRASYDPNRGRQRAPAPDRATRRNRYPLIERRICRCRAEALVRRLGYPVAPKSACVYCPYGTRGDWQRYARELPRHYARTVRLEANKGPTESGKKLSIMGYRSHKNGTYTATPLPLYIAQPYTPRRMPCLICGAAERASKVAGCGDLEAND